MLLDSVNHAVKHLSDGHVIAYPTEAVWGLGCDPFNEIAFQKLLALKQRPIEKGVILLASDIQQVLQLLNRLDNQIQKRIVASWNKTEDISRATTWLLPCDERIPHWITGQHSSVAVRVTHHPLCKKICHAFGGFIVSTSANPTGLPPAENINTAQHYFKQSVYYINGELGHSHQPSRIIDAESGRIIRD